MAAKSATVSNRGLSGAWVSDETSSHKTTSKIREIKDLTGALRNRNHRRDKPGARLNRSDQLCPRAVNSAQSRSGHPLLSFRRSRLIVMPEIQFRTPRIQAKWPKSNLSDFINELHDDGELVRIWHEVDRSSNHRNSRPVSK